VRRERSIAWSFLPISARPPATDIRVPRRLLADVDGGQARAGLQPVGIGETRISRSTPRRCRSNLGDVAHAPAARADDVATNRTAARRVLPARSRHRSRSVRPDHVDPAGISRLVGSFCGKLLRTR